MNNRVTSARGLIDTGASSSLASSHLFSQDSLEDNLLPVDWIQQSASFTTNKFTSMRFMLPQFTESSVITFPIHVYDSNYSGHQPYDVILGIDAIIELGITIDGKNKTITWENTSIPIKHISGSSPSNNEITIGKPLFATIELMHKNILSTKLCDTISNHVYNRSKIRNSNNKFINHCLMYLGLFHTLFNTCAVLGHTSPYNHLNRDDDSKCLNRDTTNYIQHLYRDDNNLLHTNLYDNFDFNKPQSYNDNVFKSNVRNEQYNPIPMNDIYYDNEFNQEYIEQSVGDVNHCWTDTFLPQECLFSSRNKISPTIEKSNYHSHSLNDVIKSNTHLTSNIQNKLLETLTPFRSLFNEKLGLYTGKPLHFRTKNEHNLRYHNPYNIPIKYLPLVKQEVDRLVSLGVIEPTRHATHAAPCFIQPKKDETIRFLTDFKELNKNIIREPFPLPKINEMIQSLGNFTFASTLDLSMGYYHLPLDDETSDLCTISLPFGTYKYKRLPPGIMPAVDCFQREMTNLFSDLDFVKVYLDDILICSHSDEMDHLHKLSIVLDRLQRHNLKVKVSKCKFLQQKVSYLGYDISVCGVSPQRNKIDAILQIAPPTSRKFLQSFLGMFNYYRRLYPTSKIDMKPLTYLTSPKVKYKWTKEADSSFNKIKEMLTHDTLLVYPDFDKPFHLDTDASKSQLGGIIYQDHGIIAYHSRRLTKYQENYSTPEKEALSIVDMLKTYSPTLMGNKIFVNTDSLNLLGKNKISSRLTRWLLLIQEYDIHLNHISGKDNLFADALSRLPRLDALEAYDCDNILPCTKFCYAFENAIPEKSPEFALELDAISREQYSDPFCAPIIQNISQQRNFFLDNVSVHNKSKILKTSDNKVVVPLKNRLPIIQFYHNELCHPSAARTYLTILSNF